MSTFSVLRAYAAGNDQLNALLDDLECEIAERYVERPVDVDDVPIRAGDAMMLAHNGRIVVVRSMELIRDGLWLMWPNGDGGAWGSYTPSRHVARACEVLPLSNRNPPAPGCEAVAEIIDKKLKRGSDA
jgi:hypothetical protein